MPTRTDPLFFALPQAISSDPQPTARDAPKVFPVGALLTVALAADPAARATARKAAAMILLMRPLYSK
ncbi:MAG: hypothetical protein AB9872_00295 [Solidesulfovibrio sp.]